MCIFCKIVNKEIPAEIIYEDDNLLAFNDINPQAPVHILIITKKHIPSLAELNSEDAGLIAEIGIAAKQIAEEQGIADSGYRLVTNVRADAGQEVPHIHYHLLGGRKMTWPPG